MSSTGRSDCRRTRDDYPTPQWCVRRLLEAVPLPAGRWLEPGAGDGSIITAVNDWMANRCLAPVTWDACELNRAYRSSLVAKAQRVVIGDFLQAGVRLAAEYDVAIGNPPFELAEAFVRECRRRARVVALLLRANFLGSEERHELFERDFPDQYLLPNRPTFAIFEKRDKAGKLKKTSSDSCEYAWFVWAGERRSHGITRRLALTPLAVRAYWRKRAPVVAERARLT